MVCKFLVLTHAVITYSSFGVSKFFSSSYEFGILYSHKVFQAFERAAAGNCAPRCPCKCNNVACCCDCISDEKKQECANRGCKSAGTNDQGKTYECTHCPDDGGCISGKSTVNLATGKVVTMSELQIGDKVQTGMAPENVTLVCF